MVYNNFRIHVMARIIVLVLTITLIAFALNTNNYTFIIILGILVLIQTVLLIRYVERSNRELARFLEAIRYSDFSQSFTTKQKGKTFAELQKAFSNIVQDFQKERADKEQQYWYLQTMVQHVGIGLLTMKSNGEIDLINNAAKKLLGIHHIKNIHELESIEKNLPETILNLPTGQKSLLKMVTLDRQLNLVASSAMFSMQGEMYKLVTMQNIASELEEKEFDAWQTLIRVLTHEIMNSVTPILSLSSTTNLIIKRQIENSPDENLEDIREALETIEKRSKGLLSFVESYRRLTRIPNPDIKVVSVKELFSRLNILYEKSVTDKDILLEFKCEPESLEMMADMDLIEQVLINLLKNAIEAMSDVENPVISVSAVIDYLGKINLKVSDNGSGMSDEIREKIFIPFYTTKEEGSGIGLSLSRQIIRLHGGSISVQSTPGKGTTFILIL